MIKIGIVGLGHMGGYHANICLNNPLLQLIGIADPHPENWTKIKSDTVVKTNNFLDWIDAVDAVIIAVPSRAHYTVAKECLLRGKHILIEKPLTKSLAEAQELFEFAHQKNLTLHVGHVERFNGAVQELKKIIDAPYLIEAHRIGPFAARVQRDTVILDLMIHDVDLILNLVNSPVRNVNVIGNVIKSQLCDIATAQIEFENGALAHIVSSRASQIKKRVMSIHQADAFIELDFTTQDISIHRHASSSSRVGEHEVRYRQEETIERLFVYKDNPLKLEIDHFINSIKTGHNRTQAELDLAALAVTITIENAVTKVI